jgi:peroxiredoxin
LSSATSALLTPGSQAPNFSNVDALLGHDTTKLSLNDYKGYNLIMIFYPGEFSVVTASTLLDINNHLNDFT